ncbi:hypothetical protein ACFX4I_24565 [Peribacillus sp. YIM B13472]
MTKAIADSGRGEPRFHGTIQNKPEDIRKLMKKLGKPESQRAEEQ